MTDRGIRDRLTPDDELNDRQLAALDSLWRARRDGSVTDAQAEAIDVLIRRGHPAGARKRITQARKRRLG